MLCSNLQDNWFPGLPLDLFAYSAFELVFVSFFRRFALSSNSDLSLNPITNREGLISQLLQTLTSVKELSVVLWVPCAHMLRYLRRLLIEQLDADMFSQMTSLEILFISFLQPF